MDKKPVLNRTFADLKPPVSAVDTPEKSGKAGRVDTVAMVEAWNLNVAAQRESIALQQKVVRHLEAAGVERAEMGTEYQRVLVSNQRTRWAMYVAALALVATLGWIHRLGIQAEKRDARIVELISAGEQRLGNVEGTLTLVADTVAAAVAAEHAKAEVEEAAEAVAVAPPRRPSAAQRATADAKRASLREKRQAAREARLVAQVKAAKAVVELAPDAPAKARAQAKMRKATGRARAAHLDVDAF